MATSKTYIVEHLDEELGPWSALEYETIARECAASGSQFVLSSVPSTLQVPEAITTIAAVRIDRQSVEETHASAKDRICLLDPAAPSELNPTDSQQFDIYLFGGILGDDPPRDRTSELRKKGFQGRRLGPVQMTTDTAVRVTRMVIEGGMTLDVIPYTDHPELKISAHESTQMPFRYVRDEQGRPVMPTGMIDLIKKDSEKTIDDLF